MLNNPTTFTLYFQGISTNKLKKLNLFWTGFIVYTISYVFSESGYLNFKVCQAIQLFGLLLLIPTGFKLVSFKFSDKYLQFTFNIYCLWLSSVIIRGFTFDYEFLKTMFFDASYGFLSYSVPLIILFPTNPPFFHKLFKVIILLAIISIIFDAAFIKDLLSSDHSSFKNTTIIEKSALLSIPASFLILTYPYHSIKIRIFAVTVITLTLLFAIIRARRGLIFICVSQMTFSYLLYLINSKRRILSIVLIISLIFIGVNIYKDAFVLNKNNIFRYLIERGTEDTRTGVELYFYDDLKTKDWVYGRGINGQYFCPGIDQNNITGYRSVIETGYLQTILKGGIISLVLILLITIPAIINGLFYSKNILSKASGFWIVLWVFYLYPATTESFSLYYILLWIAIGICYSKKIRFTSEHNMKLLIQLKK